MGLLTSFPHSLSQFPSWAFGQETISERYKLGMKRTIKYTHVIFSAAWKEVKNRFAEYRTLKGRLESKNYMSITLNYFRINAWDNNVGASLIIHITIDPINNLINL